jgi:hypothetical protein
VKLKRSWMMKWPCGWINEVEMEMRGGTMMMSVAMRLQTASMMLEVMELQ